MEQKKIILDLALGDGYISKPKGEKGNSCLTMKHSLKQKEYLLHKMKILNENGIKTIYRETTSGIHGVCYVMTGKLPIITEIRNLMYPNGKKIVPKEYIENMCEKSLALFFQDDGGHGIIKRERKKLKSGSISYLVKPYIGQFVFSTNVLDEESINFLCKKMNSFGIETKVYDRKGPVIVISKIESKKIFVELIKPFMCPSMMYKIDRPLSNHGKL
jgi:hypothetical protein